MKVLFVCPFVPWPLVTGGKIRTYHLIRAASRHAEIHLRMIREPGIEDEALDALLQPCASVAMFERGKPGPWMRWSRPKLERWFHSPALAVEVGRELGGGDFDLVHLDELLLARVVSAGTTPVVQHHHKLDTVLYQTLRKHALPHQQFDLWKLARLEAESARRTRHHITCSEGDAAILRERYGDLTTFALPSGFDHEHFRPSDPPAARDPLELLYLGSMDYGPNVDAMQRFVHDCMPELRRRHPGVRLTIVGRDPVDDVRALAGEDVEVTGGVDDVRPYLARAGQMVVPLRIGGGTRLKIVEALAMGTPVTSTAIGAQGLGLESGRHLTLVDDTAGMIEAVSAAITDPAAAAQRGEAGRVAVHERYRWDVLGDRLVEAWEAVRGARP